MAGRHVREEGLGAKVQAMSGAGLAVVLTMCAALLLVVATACWLAISETPMPDVLDRVLGGLLIGVPALLAKTYRDVTKPQDDEPQEVEVVNNASQPVPTAETLDDARV